MKRIADALAMFGVLAAACILVLAAPQSANAAWSASAGGAATARATTILPPTGLTGSTQCVLALALPRPRLTWQATPSTFATGYDVLRSTTSGGPYSLHATVVGRTTTEYVDAISLIGGQTYHYVIRARSGNWRSTVTAQVSVTLPTLLCPLF